MCGINGFTFSDQRLVDAMNEATKHRGPDETQSWVGEGITLGHNRLAIIDLSERGRQPMWDAAREIGIVFNGEIYNFKELRMELERHYSFRSNSDTEVLLYAYRHFGIDFLNRLNGIFAFAIWDARSNELIVARDRIGVNPLYYANHQGQFIFSSEIKALLVHGIPRDVDPAAFNLYFQLLYLPEPYTMFAHVKKLPPAHYARVKNGTVSLHRYWTVTDTSDITSRSEAVRNIQMLFHDSVRRELISDRPVGVFLSGGVDSTAVLGAVQAITKERSKTYSVGFKDSTDEAKFNTDFYAARETAKWYKTDHHELFIGQDDVVDHLPKIAWHLDEPNSNATAAAMYLLSRLAKEKVAVVLGGDGGDELFGGYPRYYWSRVISQFQRLPKGLRGLVAAGIRLSGRQSDLLKLGLPPSVERIAAFLCQKPSQVASVVAGEVYNATAALRTLAELYGEPESADFEKFFMNVDRQSWLPNESLLRTNKMTMAFGLESRVPILDHRLVELSQKIPTRWKISLLGNRPNAFVGKTIWREAVHKYLPPHIRSLQKRGWFTPMAKWMRVGPMRELVEEMLRPSALPGDLFNTTEIQRLWTAHREHREYHFPLLWAIVMWQLWRQKYHP